MLRIQGTAGAPKQYSVGLGIARARMPDLSSSSFNVPAGALGCLDRHRRKHAGSPRFAGTKPLRILCLLVLLCGAGRAADGPHRNTTLPQSEFVKLPVMDTQDIRFIPVSADGRSIQVRIWSVVQDNYGFLWFGTSDGLYRYDGYSLNRYRNGRHQ